MVRFYTPNLDEACDALDLYDIDYDLDDGNRIMVDDSLYDDALDAFDEYDIEYEEVQACCAITKSVLKSLAHFVVPSLKTKHPALSGVIHATVAC